MNVKKNNYSILKMLKSGKYPENIYYQKNIKINSYISYNFLSNEEYIIKFKEYYITKYDIDIISKNYEIIKERNKNLENHLNDLNDLKNEIVRLKNYNTILLNKITDLENQILKKNTELEFYKSKSPQQLWLIDLDNLSKLI